MPVGLRDGLLSSNTPFEVSRVRGRLLLYVQAAFFDVVAWRVGLREEVCEVSRSCCPQNLEVALLDSVSDPVELSPCWKTEVRHEVPQAPNHLPLRSTLNVIT